MFRSSVVVRRLAFAAPTPIALSARLVPVGQPAPGDTTWFSRNPHVGSVKGAPSIDQVVCERMVEQLSEKVAEEVARKQARAAIDESVHRHAAAAVAEGEEGAATSSSPSSSSNTNTVNTKYARVNITQDVLNAAKADFDDMIKDATAQTHEGSAVKTKEEAQKYVEQLDLGAMPTIPGMSKEELALKLLEFQKVKAQQAAQHLSGDAERNRRLNQIEVMRMSLPPKQFKEFMVKMEASAQESEAELEAMRHMTPEQLYAYQSKKERTKIFWQWVNFILVWMMAFGGTAMTYYLMYEYFAI